MSMLMQFSKFCKSCKKLFWFSLGEDWREFCPECEKEKSCGNVEDEEDIT